MISIFLGAEMMRFACGVVVGAMAADDRARSDSRQELWLMQTRSVCYALGSTRQVDLRSESDRDETGKMFHQMYSKQSQNVY